MGKKNFSFFFFSVLLVLFVLQALAVVAQKNFVNLPVNIKVVLIGFQKNGAYEVDLSATSIHDLLDRVLPSHEPVIRGRGINELSGVKYNLEYEVLHYPLTTALELESTIALNAKPDPSNPGSFDVEITRMQPFFELMLGKLNDPKSPSARDDEGGHQIKNSFVVFIGNPSKSRFRTSMTLLWRSMENQASGDFRYRYKMGQGFGRSQTWIGASEYCFVDLSAGPVKTGSMPSAFFEKADSGTIFTTRNLPNIEKLLVGMSPSENVESVLARKDHELILDITKVVQSAITQVFLPNIGFETNVHADRVVVPLLVFRNHDLVDPFGKSESAAKNVEAEPFLVDMPALEGQIRKMLLPKQKMTLVKGTHFLHDHQTISLALQKATKYKAGPLAEDLHQEKYPYIDADVLLHELGHSDDLLAAALFGTSEDSMEYNESPTSFDRVFDQLDHLGDFDPELIGNLKAKMTSSRKQGIRVVPVYIFSLFGKSEDLLFDGKTLVHSTKNAVLVLQTNSSHAAAPYFQDDARVFLDARNVTQQILCGLATSLGGLESPLTRVPATTLDEHEDFTWILGYHPFGPFTASTQISSAITNAILRNHIISRIHVAKDFHRQAERDILYFLSDYIDAPSNSNLEGYLRSLILDSSLLPKGGSAKLLQLNRSAVDLQSSFDDVAKLMEQAEFRKAYQQSAVVLNRMTKFSSFVKQELTALRSDLQCCVSQSRLHAREEGSSTFFELLFTLFRLGLVVGVIWWVLRKQ